MEHATSSSIEFNVIHLFLSENVQYRPSLQVWLSVNLWDTELTSVEAPYERGPSHRYCQEWE